MSAWDRLMVDLWQAWVAMGSEEASEALLVVRVLALGKIQEVLPIQDTQHIKLA